MWEQPVFTCCLHCCTCAIPLDELPPTSWKSDPVFSTNACAGVPSRTVTPVRDFGTLRCHSHSLVLATSAPAGVPSCLMILTATAGRAVGHILVETSATTCLTYGCLPVCMLRAGAPFCCLTTIGVCAHALVHGVHISDVGDILCLVHHIM
jgi:hypothetical protein